MQSTGIPCANILHSMCFDGCDSRSSQPWFGFFTAVKKLNHSCENTTNNKSEYKEQQVWSWSTAGVEAKEDLCLSHKVQSFEQILNVDSISAINRRKVHDLPLKHQVPTWALITRIQLIYRMLFTYNQAMTMRAKAYPHSCPHSCYHTLNIDE